MNLSATIARFRHAVRPRRTAGASALPKRSARHTVRRAASTLVELLVVIEIIALLISTLLPALNSAKRHAQTVMCKSNLAQISLATRMYSNDKHDHYPADEAGSYATKWEGLKGNAEYRRGPGYNGSVNDGDYSAWVADSAIETVGLPCVPDRLKY